MKMWLDDRRVVWQDLDGEAVILDLVRSTYLSVNPSGTVMIKSLAAGADRQDLVAVLVHEYGLSEAEASQDVNAFLASLEERNLITATDPRQR